MRAALAEIPQATLYPPALRGYQSPMWDSEARIDLTVSAPQLGKSFVLGLWLLAGAWKDGGRWRNWPSCWAAPTYQQSRSGFLRYVVEPGVQAGVIEPGAYTTTVPLEAELVNGSRLRAVSWDNPKGIYGDTYSRIAVDEFGLLTPEGWAALSSRTTESAIHGLGDIRGAGNVTEVNGIAEKLYGSALLSPRQAARTWTWRDRAAAATCECGLNGQGLEIEHADLHDDACERGSYLSTLQRRKATMSDAHFRQLYCAEWIDWSALPVYAFDRAVNVAKPDLAEKLHQPSLPLDLACDFNTSKESIMAWVVGQHRRDEAWTLDEIGLPGGGTTQDACNEFLRRFPVSTYNPKGVRVLNVYGDASGSSHSTKSTETDYEIIAKVLRPHWPQIRFHVPAANGPVTDRVNAVNAMLKSASGGTRYLLHPRCERLATDYARVSYKPGTRDLLKDADKKLTHFSDADGYRIVAEFPVAGPAKSFMGGRTGEIESVDMNTVRW